MNVLFLEVRSCCYCSCLRFYFEPPGMGNSSGRPTGSLHHSPIPLPCSVLILYREVTNSETAGPATSAFSACFNSLMLKCLLAANSFSSVPAPLCARP